MAERSSSVMAEMLKYPPGSPERSRLLNELRNINKQRHSKYIIKKEYLKTLGLTEYYIDLTEHARANIRDEEFARASITEDKKNRTIEIYSIYVPKKYQGIGIGTKLIYEILKDADAKCMKSIVKPAGEIDSPGYLKLKNYYTQFGFSIDKELSEEPDIIILSRRPKCSA